MSTIQEKISIVETVLNTLEIKYRTVIHPIVMTSEAHDKECAELLSTSCVLAKNLFLKDKKKKDSLFFLLVVKADRRVNLKLVSNEAGVKEIRFADEQSLLKTLGVSQGCVTPLAVMNDKNSKVIVLFDSLLEDIEMLGVHPLTNEATTFMTPADLKKFIKHHNNEFRTIDLGPIDSNQAKSTHTNTNKNSNFNTNMISRFTKLDEHFSKQSYFKGEFLTEHDFIEFQSLLILWSEKDNTIHQFPHLMRWMFHIQSFKKIKFTNISYLNHPNIPISTFNNNQLVCYGGIMIL